MSDWTIADRRYDPTDALLKRYGLSRAEYREMFDDQGGACAICEESLYHVHIDHDHQTMQVRGLLCPRCNTKIVYALETRLIAAARRYLQRWKRKRVKRYAPK